MLLCLRFRKWLGAYLDGELSLAKRLLIETHLGRCETCRTALEDIRNLESVLLRLEVPPVPVGLAGRVMVLAREKAAQLQRPVLWNPGQWWLTISAPGRAASVAMLFAGLITGLALGWRTGWPTEPPGQVCARIQSELLDTYNLDVLSEMPRGSLADVYLTLVIGPDSEER
jgi:anti-sigma factor RsiW